MDNDNIRRPLAIRGGMLTDRGLIRTHNEDCARFVIPRDGDPHAGRGALVLVADGMGGHAAGEVASEIATEAIFSVYYGSPLAPLSALRAAFAEANRRIREYAEANPLCSGMGTTCTAVAVHDNRAYLAHVGDSRAYLMRAGSLRQLSEDDSLVAQMVRDGLITAEAASRRADRNVILRALGIDAEIEPQCRSLDLSTGDRLLLCSDGLSDLVSDTAILSALRDHEPIEACRILIDRALDAGGSDNVSAGVFLVTDARPLAQPAGITRTIVLEDSCR